MNRDTCWNVKNIATTSSNVIKIKLFVPFFSQVKYDLECPFSNAHPLEFIISKYMARKPDLIVVAKASFLVFVLLSSSGTTIVKRHLQ